MDSDLSYLVRIVCFVENNHVPLTTSLGIKIKHRQKVLCKFSIAFKNQLKPVKKKKKTEKSSRQSANQCSVIIWRNCDYVLAIR